MVTDITTIIKARTKNQLLTIAERPLIASGDANTVLVHFEFDPTWSAFTVKFACFNKANTPNIVHKMLISDDGYATVPHEVLDEAGDIFFGVKGYIPDHPEVVKTSLNVKYNIMVGVSPASSAPPTPDEFEQMMQAMAEIEQNFSEEVDDIDAALRAAEANSAAQFAKNEKSIAKNEKRITNLEQGLMGDAFETDASVAFQKTVPSTALPYAEVQEVGGMSYAVGGAIKSAAVSAIESVGRNILDFSTAFNSCFLDNGDGTYTFTKISNSDRFSLKFPLYIPAGTPVVGYFEVVSTNLSDKRISLQLYNAEGKSVDAMTLANGGLAYPSKQAYTARFYLDSGNADGSYITFKNPMISMTSTIMPYAPYKKRTYPIPDEVQALEGWGLGVNETYHNRIDWENKQYRQEVRKIVLDGTASISYSNARFMMYDILNGASSKGYAIPCICNEYAYNKNVSGDSNREDGITTGGNMVLIRDARFTTAASFNAYLAERKAAGDPVVLIYALSTPIITDISHILPDDNLIEVDGGGALMAVNEQMLAAPTEIIYQLKGVAE